MDETAEQIAAELAASQAVVKEEEVRDAVIAEYGFDEVDDAERIDKMVAKEVEHRTKLSQAIGQKIKHRTDAEELRKKVAIPPQEKTNVPPVDVEKIVAEQLEKRDLDALEYSDELKTEIQRIAKLNNISVKQAVRDPYIAFKLNEYEREQKTEEASISRTNRSGGRKTYTFDNPPVVDMSNEKGRAEWDAYLDDMRKQGH